MGLKKCILLRTTYELSLYVDYITKCGAQKGYSAVNGLFFRSITNSNKIPFFSIGNYFCHDLQNCTANKIK